MLREFPWRYTIAGEGPERHSLETLTARLGLNDRVSFAGRVSEPVKAAMLAGADLALWPERTPPAFGLVGLEAMLPNTPVLATVCGAIPEVLCEEGGWLADAPTPAAFAAALRPLFGRSRSVVTRRAGLRESALPGWVSTA
jgi:glycosyltransferase involved in cell wall biosynthesis